MWTTEEDVAAAAAHSLRLSASFFSLGIPGDVCGVSVGLAVVLGSVVPVVLVSVVLEGAGSVGEGWSFFMSCGGLGFRNVSLLTEMKALPGVENGT